MLRQEAGDAESVVANPIHAHGESLHALRDSGQKKWGLTLASVQESISEEKLKAQEEDYEEDDEDWEDEEDEVEDMENLHQGIEAIARIFAKVFMEEMKKDKGDGTSKP